MDAILYYNGFEAYVTDMRKNKYNYTCSSYYVISNVNHHIIAEPGNFYNKHRSFWPSSEIEKVTRSG